MGVKVRKAAGVEESATPAPPAESEASPELSVLPLEVLEMTLAHLDDVRDLANLALSSSEFRGLLYTCDGCWEKAFIRDYNSSNAEDYRDLPTWRQRYMACTLDTTCIKLREKAEVFDELEDATAALERSVADTMRELSRVDDALSDWRSRLNEELGKVAGCSSTHAGSKLCAAIMAATRSRAPPQGETPPWRQRLTLEARLYIRAAADEVDRLTAAMAEKKDALRTLMDALSVQQASTKRVQDSIQALRQKRASLEAATAYRHIRR